MQPLDLRPFPAVEKSCSVDEDVAPVVDHLAIAIDLNLVDSPVFDPGRTEHSRVKLDIWIELVLVREILEILPYLWCICIECGPVWIRLESVCILN